MNKTAYRHRDHVDRYKRYVLSRTPRLVCQECRGRGEVVEDIIDFGDEGVYLPYEMTIPCGWCQGTGYVSPYMRGFWLRWKMGEKNRDKSKWGGE